MENTKRDEPHPAEFPCIGPERRWKVRWPGSRQGYDQQKAVVVQKTGLENSKNHSDWSVEPLSLLQIYLIGFAGPPEEFDLSVGESWYLITLEDVRGFHDGIGGIINGHKLNQHALYRWWTRIQEQLHAPKLHEYAIQKDKGDA